MTPSACPDPGRRTPTVLDLPDLIAALPPERRIAFDRIFHVAVAAGAIDPPDSMRPWIEAQFGSLEAARRWFAAAHEADPPAVYPLVLWNCLWRAGSSIEHGHFQLLMAAGRHYAEMERLRRDAGAYRAATATDYFDDLYAVHESVGA